MNYISRFGLEFNPFIKNTKDSIYDSDEYKEIKYRLDYLCEIKGFGLFTGQPGVGKTTALRNWSSKLNPSLYKVVYISLSTLTVLEFYKTLAVQLGLAPLHRKSQNFMIIQDEINRLVFEKKITPVIILDEANHLLNGILNDLKMLFNFEMDSKDRAIIILAGLPSLNNTLRLLAHEPLRQRIMMNYNIDSLNKLETKEYILKKLTDAGCRIGIFEESCFDAIANASNGLPRLINKFVNASLLIADRQKVDIISNDIIMLAVNDLTLD